MIKSRKVIIFIALVFITAYPVTAHAYVGPGLGLSFIGALIGVILTLLAAIWAVLSWPIRSFFRRNRKKSDKETDGKR